MKKIRLLAIILLISCFRSYSQSKSPYFIQKNLFSTGVYYYPEHWDKSQWDRDLKNIASMGFEFTHFAEFAWQNMEPSEGVYDFTWLDEAIALADKHKLKVIICTPTPTPPAWMATKYPEIMMRDELGIDMKHGSRQSISWSSQKYRELTEKLILKMAAKYGNDKRIMGWQLDNEPCHYGKRVDNSPESIASFRKWLQKKYGTLSAFNKAWGNAFWGMTYSSFDEVRFPLSTETTAGINNHAVLDMRRYMADEVADFLTFQYSILKKNISATQWVTTNFIHINTNVDHRRSSNLDFTTYTIYPVAGYSPASNEVDTRVGEWWRMSFSNDFFRPVNHTNGVMELQPGQVNWGHYNSQPYPGVVRAWLWNAFAGGLDFACSYRFRQPLFGNEQYHYGMVNTDGITPTPGGLEYSKFISEIKMLRKEFDPKKASINTDFQNARTGYLFEFDNFWDIDQQKQTYQWNTSGFYLTNYYANLKSLRVPVDVIPEKQDFSKYKVLVAPAYQLVDKELVARWKTYAMNGGNLVLTCRAGQKDRTGKLWEGKWAEPILDLIGAKIKFYDVLPDQIKANVEMDGKNYEWNNWSEILEPDANTQVWATHTNQYYKGTPSIIHRKLGKGTVTYIGTYSDNFQLEKDALKKVYDVANIKIVELPKGMVVEYRDGFGIAINYGTDEVDAPLPNNAKILIGQKKLKTAEVVVWKE